METAYQNSSGYYGLKIHKNHVNPHVTFAPPMLLPRLKVRKRRFNINAKQRHTEVNFFMPAPSDRNKQRNVDDKSTWKMAVWIYLLGFVCLFM
jgi:hypothetical protein